MDEIVGWLHGFLDAEHTALIASYVERDDARYRTALDAYESHLGAGVRGTVRRPVSPEESWFEIGAEAVAGQVVAKRTLFQVKHYLDDKFGDIYRAYVGGTKTPAPGCASYSASLFVADVDGLYVVSVYDHDIIPQQEGHRLRDGQLSWVWAGGVELSELGEPLAVRKLKPPEVLEHRNDYDSGST